LLWQTIVTLDMTPIRPAAQFGLRNEKVRRGWKKYPDRYDLNVAVFSFDPSMKKMSFYVIVVAVSLVSWTAAASPLDDKVAALKKAMKEEVTATPTSKDTDPARPQRMEPRFLADSVDELLAQAENPAMGPNVESQLRQLLSAFNSQAVQQTGHDVIDELHKEQEAKTDAAAATIQDLLKRVSTTVANAKKPEDLDDLLVELQKFQNDRNGAYDPGSQALYQQVTNAFEFVKIWQNYLSHTATGQGQLANQDLQNLSQNNYSVGIIPRSEILALLSSSSASQTHGQTGMGDQQVALASEEMDIVKNVNSMDDLEPALQKLNDLQSKNPGDYIRGRPEVLRLVAVIRTYESIKAGLPVDIQNNTLTGDSSIKPEVLRDLLVYALQHYFSSYKGAAPTPTEDVAAYVSRVMADAATRQDWTLLKQTLSAETFLEASSALDRMSPQASMSGLSFLLAGMNQEDAGQYMLAVVSYQNALKELPSQVISPN
jgi:hypothetical protein